MLCLEFIIIEYTVTGIYTAVHMRVAQLLMIHKLTF